MWHVSLCVHAQMCCKLGVVAEGQLFGLLSFLDQKFLPIIPAWFLILFGTYCSQNYASI